MNREQRRKTLKQMTPNIVENKIKDCLEYQKREMLKEFKREKIELIEVMSIMTAWVLNYKLGLGKKRLPEIMDDIMKHYTYFADGTLKPEDYDEIKKQIAKMGILGENKNEK